MTTEAGPARAEPSSQCRLIVYMRTTTIRVTAATRDRLNALARRRGKPAGQLVDELVRDADDASLLESAAQAWGRMASEPKMAAAYRAEAAELEGFVTPLPDD